MIVHFILHGETLESIAEEIKLENPKYLIEYHNQKCAREDYINDRLIPGKKLLIPDSNTVREYNSRNDAPFKSPALNPEIPFKPEKLDKRYTLGIIENEQNEERTSESSVFCTVALKWIGYENGEHVFHFSKLDFYNRNDSIVGDLAEECIKSLNPVEIRTNNDGEVISVHTDKKILDDFGAVKEKLMDLYPGEYSRIYIEEFEYAVLNQGLFSKRMKQDLFIKIYFAPLRNKFINGKSHYRLSFTDDNILMNIAQEAEQPEVPGETILIQHYKPSGEEKDMGLNGKYILEKETGLIKKADIEYHMSRYSVKSTTKLLIEELD
ncbi:hypothetical protein [Chryseobacterium gossypii]|uniref:hypothetical protein n=1 Tax=Chryseobacterium gossypii TaxID=3231602 RepID=UPI0035236334